MQFQTGICCIKEGFVGLEGYALIDNCKEISTFAFGKGKCCAADFKIKFKSGKKTTDSKGWEFTLKIEQEGVSCFYEGVGAINVSYPIFT